MNKVKKQGSVSPPWSVSAGQVLDRLSASREGLSQKEVRNRRKKQGLNLLRKKKKKSFWVILVSQFKSLIIILLALASVLSLLFHEPVQAAAIAAALLINAVIGFITELKATRSMEALQELSRVHTKVRRAGQARKIRAEQVVPGDVIIIESGDIVSADIRLFESSKIQSDESALTGESVPVSKSTEPVGKNAPLAERACMLYKGTFVNRGSGAGVVVGTGKDTELGRISTLVEEAEDEVTPLEKRLEHLGNRLIWMTAVIAVLVAGSGVLAGRNIFLMIETSIALAIAAIPEGLPIVATIALARGMWLMAKRNALIERLSSVETLGSTGIICTDKTGTLTENRMTVREILIPEEMIHIEHDLKSHEMTFRKQGRETGPEQDQDLKDLLRIGVLCNNAEIKDRKHKKALGDPLESALIETGLQADINREDLIREMPEEREEAFDPETKKMATFHKTNGGYFVAVKGAPESILEACRHIIKNGEKSSLEKKEKENWLRHAGAMGKDGLRVLALAFKTVPDKNAEPYSGLVFAGLAGLFDPPRKDVAASIEQCRKAGIRVVMVTGDQPMTASHVARMLNMIKDDEQHVMEGRELEQRLSSEEKHDTQCVLDTSVFARITPRQKLELIRIYQDDGHVVAMTGDGVNDAPALKKADIGIAMGKRGTQVAREAADMILKDDSFATIVTAVKHGRIIFKNIRKFLVYLLPCHVSEIVAVATATVAGAPLPVLPLQILFLNIVTDVFPALALGVGKGSDDVMSENPRASKEPLLPVKLWIRINIYGLLMAASVLGALFLAISWLKLTDAQAVSVSFLTLGFTSLWHVFNVRDKGSSFFRNEVTENPYVWGALAIGSALLLCACFLPGVSDVLKCENPGIRGWGLIIVMSLIPWILIQSAKSMKKKR